MNSGEKIKALRLARGLTLEDVGQYVGVGKSTVRKWETGAIANMRRDKIPKLAEVLGTTPAYIIWIYEEGDPSAGAGSRPVSDEDIKAAFWGGEQDLSPEEIDALWAETKDYIAFRTAQRKKKKK